MYNKKKMLSQFLSLVTFQYENVFVAISFCKENDDEKDDGNTVKSIVFYLYEEIRKCETRVCHFDSLFITEMFFFFFFLKRFYG